MIFTIDRERALLNQYVPSGGVWSAKTFDTSDLSRILLTFASLFNKVRNESIKYANELDVFKANELIGEWEMYVGLPDDVFISIPSDLQQRINNVVYKLIGYRIRSLEDLKRFISSVFGVNVEITNAQDMGFDYTFGDYYFFDNYTAANAFIVKIPQMEGGFDYTFDYTFEDDVSEIILNFIKSIAMFYDNIILDIADEDGFNYLLDSEGDNVIDSDGNEILIPF